MTTIWQSNHAAPLFFSLDKRVKQFQSWILWRGKLIFIKVVTKTVGNDAIRIVVLQHGNTLSLNPLTAEFSNSRMDAPIFSTIETSRYFVKFTLGLDAFALHEIKKINNHEMEGATTFKIIKTKIEHR